MKTENRIPNDEGLSPWKMYAVTVQQKIEQFKDEYPFVDQPESHQALSVKAMLRMWIVQESIEFLMDLYNPEGPDPSEYADLLSLLQIYAGVFQETIPTAVNAWAQKETSKRLRKNTILDNRGMRKLPTYEFLVAKLEYLLPLFESLVTDLKRFESMKATVQECEASKE